MDFSYFPLFFIRGPRIYFVKTILDWTFNKTLKKKLLPEKILLVFKCYYVSKVQGNESKGVTVVEHVDIEML